METILDMNVFAQVIIGLIVFLFIVTMVYSAVIKNTYRRLIKDISNKDNRTNVLFKYRMHNDMIDDFNEAMGRNIDEVNTISIIEKNISLHMKGVHFGERLVKKASSLMIILGLLGTFYGLVISIDELVVLLSDGQQANSVESITSGLISSITGMSVAFITSMFGIGAAILTSFTSILFGLASQKETLIVSLEEYLDNHLSLANNGLGGVDKDGKTALSISFDKFNESLTQSLRSVTEEITSRLSEATGDMVLTAESVKSSIVKFDHSLNMFSDNIRDFTEFNHHLRANIQRLNVGLDNFNDQIEAKTKLHENHNEKIIQLTESLDNMRKEG